MIVLEGLMLVPPERGTIIGRALWKSRYVVLGTGSMLKTQNDLLPQNDTLGRGSSGRKKGLKSTSAKPSLVDVSQPDPAGRQLYITIYKAKGDWEFIAQHPVSAFKSCEIRALQHRKQSPSLPTMMFEMKPDSISEKQRKRRSSRTGGLSSKDPWINFLLFRTIPEERHSIHDWQAAVKPLLTPGEEEEDGVMSPLSPVFNGFTNPFGSRRPSTSANRPEIGNRASSQSSYPHAPTPRERPSAMISPSPSLRSRRSDLSSQASSQPPHMGFASPHPHGYATTLPTDLPSPASTAGYDNQFIEGWTSAQGRSSALSSHTRGSNSIASAVTPVMPIASTPPGPRETILDRAFQMRCIPGSDRMLDKEDEKISSIARFEALMREVDERKHAKESNKHPKERQDWGLEEESEDSSDGEPDNDDDIEMSDEELSIPTPAQRALDYISGRRTPISTANRPLSPTPRSPPVPFLNPQAMSAFHGNSGSNGLRPRTGTNPSNPRPKGSRPTSLALPSRSISSNAIPTLRDRDSNNSTLRAGSTDSKDIRRRSSTSVKRLSFTEFAKRLSSTSSLLLVQTNNSSSSGRDGSGRGSSEYGVEELDRSNNNMNISMRGGDLASRNRDKRCGWRGSVGAFGPEGGFL
ncbi:hypothetical protein VTL71DRAFT_15902 [Oculimacula yallundae]|uniref:PH domain-containing protein n=1 Tax=Oculimacula yallundae TaxID=86028 RepID=A0ABR4CEB8_9HELO